MGLEFHTLGDCLLIQVVVFALFSPFYSPFCLR